MKSWRQRLVEDLEPVLHRPDPRPGISAYHDMPFAIFHYPPEDEFDLRREVGMLRTRLEQSGKKVHVISLAECLNEALEAEGLNADTLAEAELAVGLDSAIETVHQVISDYRPLDDLVAERIPENADPLVEIAFIVRAGALFPFYRTSSLLEQMRGKVHIPTVLFYPGELEGAAGLRFMGVLDPEHNYRPRIF